MRRLAALALGTALALGAACGDLDRQIVARELAAPAPESEAGVEPDAGGADPVLDAAPGVDAEPPPSPASRARGRVAVVDGRLVTDVGSPLRGMALPVDVGWQLPDLQLLRRLADENGFNTVHVYLENSTQPSGTMLAEADAIVSLAEQAGLYVVLGIGGGQTNGSFDSEKVFSFWTLYAARYGASPHVLFEIQNNPEFTCDEPVQEATMAMQREAYTLIRSLAPDTHVVLLSTSAVPEISVLEDAIARLDDLVDWSNASIAMHTDIECVPLARLDEVEAATSSAGVPFFISQLPEEGWEAHVREYESRGISWMHIIWFGKHDDLSTLRAQTSAADLTWCPDWGSFPEDAEACRAP